MKKNSGGKPPHPKGKPDIKKPPIKKIGIGKERIKEIVYNEVRKKEGWNAEGGRIAKAINDFERKLKHMPPSKKAFLLQRVNADKTELANFEQIRKFAQIQGILTYEETVRLCEILTRWERGHYVSLAEKCTVAVVMDNLKAKMGRVVQVVN